LAALGTHCADKDGELSILEQHALHLIWDDTLVSSISVNNRREVGKTHDLMVSVDLQWSQI